LSIVGGPSGPGGKNDGGRGAGTDPGGPLEPIAAVPLDGSGTLEGIGELDGGGAT
jgi:hypothetical protein